jgi:dihydrodipicolinate synthase/N-acetylneuraminate lyase
VAGIVVLGSTGEAVMLSDSEQREVFRIAREAAEPEKVLIAGTGHESARETISRCEYVAELGYDACMVRTPHYFKSQLQPANLLTYYRTVCDHSPLPVIIYNFPQCTGYDMPVEVIAELAGHSNLIGIKESSGNVVKAKQIVDATKHVKRTAAVTEVFAAVTGRMTQPAKAAATGGEFVAASSLGGPATATATPAIKTRSKEVGFQVLVGSAQKLLPSLQAGAVGAILAFANPAPTACYEIYAAWKEGDDKLALEKQQRIVAAATRIAGELSVPGIKYAMDLNGYFGGSVRLPLLPLTAELKQEVELVMADIRN